MSEVERYPRVIEARIVEPVRVPDVPGLIGRKLHPAVVGVAEWSGHKAQMQRELRKAMKRGEVAGAYEVPGSTDQAYRIQVQLLPRRPRNWAKISILSALALAGIGTVAWVVHWVAGVMAAAALGATQGGGLFVLLLIGALLLAAGGGTITVTTVTKVKRSLF